MNTKTIAQAPTVGAYGIAIERNLRSGRFHVTRYVTHGANHVAAGRFVVLSTHATESAARAEANRQWRGDRQATA